MRIRDFGVEIWMNRWEDHCRFNLAETCVDSVTIDELLSLAGSDRAALVAELGPMRLGYGAIEGTGRLRTAIAALYETRTADQIIVTHGAIGANHLAYTAMVEPGDVVVSVVPTYQQHTSIPESLGGEVRTLLLREDAGWLPDLDELRGLARGAKLISLVNPNNPTGSLLDGAAVDAIAAIARAEGAWILADEVYRGLDQDGEGTSPSFADRYERTIGVGGMSKAFSLAGVRLGWITAPAEVLEAVTRHRDYSVISVGMVDDLLAAIALEAAPAMLARNRAIVRGNLALLDAWVAEEPRVSYVRPRSGTTALLRIDAPGLDAEAFCSRLLDETGVLLVPGSAFDLAGVAARIGYANDPGVLVAGLEQMSGFFDSL
ncbi:MAG: aminotransferase class I/II-fold pyridoxal phosphate-dependent enzyme [Chloroflexota bacterium]